MAPPLRKVIVTESVSPLGRSTFNVSHQKNYKRGFEKDDSEQAVLSPTESEILDAIKPDDSVKELPTIKKRKEPKKSKFPQLVQSLGLVNRWKADVLSPRTSSFQILKNDPEKEETGLRANQSERKQKEKLFPGEKDHSSPDTLVNLVRLALRNGLLGSYFSRLADENAEELLKWQERLTECLSHGMPPPLDELENCIQQSLLTKQSRLPQLEPAKMPQKAHRKKITGTNNQRKPKEPQHIFPPTVKGILKTTKNDEDINSKSTNMRVSEKLRIHEDATRLSRPKKPGDYNKVYFKGWDFGTYLGKRKISKLPELSERAPQLLRREPPKIPLDKMVEPTGADSLSPDEYLSLFAIYELFEFLIYTLALEKPDRPIDHVIEMTRAIKRLALIKGETRHRMNEMENLVDALLED